MGDYWATRTKYDLLEVEPDATPAEIATSHRLLSRVWHPDRQHESIRADCDQRLAAINEAHATLSDPIRRERYDMTELLTKAGSGSPGAAMGGPFDEAVWNSPRVWFQMAGWMKDEDSGKGFHRKMAYAAGDALERDRQPSDKQLPYMLEARDIAVSDGFDPYGAVTP